jgi:hypothetical protein
MSQQCEIPGRLENLPYTQLKIDLALSIQRKRPGVSDDVRAKRASSGAFLIEPTTLRTDGTLWQCSIRFNVRVDLKQSVDDTALFSCPLLTAFVTARAGKSEHALWRISLAGCGYELWA